MVEKNLSGGITLQAKDIVGFGTEHRSFAYNGKACVISCVSGYTDVNNPEPDKKYDCYELPDGTWVCSTAR